MSITANWLLEQSSIEGFSLLAGEVSDNLIISGINIMDNPDTIPWLTKGTLVLSTGYLLTDETMRKDLIKKLSERGCAGIGIKMNRYLNEVPADMKEQADALHFPILCVPYASSMDQIANLVYRKLYEEELSETQQLALAYRRLTECVLNNQSLHSLLKIVFSELSSTVFLTNDSFELLAECEREDEPVRFPFPFNKDVYTLFPPADVMHLREETANANHPSLSYQMEWNGHDLPFILFPIRSKQALLGYLVFLDTKNCFTSYCYHFAENATSIFCLAMMNHTVLTRSGRSSKDMFFRNLLSGSLQTSSELEPLCIQNAFDFQNPRLCLVLGIPEYEHMTLPKRRAFERKYFNLLDDCFSDSPYADSYRLIHTPFQEYLVFFIIGHAPLSANEASLLGLSVSGLFCDALSEHDVSCHAAVGKYTSGALSIYPCFKQAVSALGLGARIHPDSSCFSYYQDQVYHSLIQSYTHEQLVSLYQEYLEPLAIYDKENDSQLKETVRTYLKCRQNISQTAKELFIHRNTMFYRLEQIRNILHVDFENEDDVYKLETGFYIEKTLQY